jgi:hypothetical protein
VIEIGERKITTSQVVLTEIARIAGQAGQQAGVAARVAAPSTMSALLNRGAGAFTLATRKDARIAAGRSHGRTVPRLAPSISLDNRGYGERKGGGDPSVDAGRDSLDLFRGVYRFRLIGRRVLKRTIRVIQGDAIYVQVGRAGHP